MNKNTLSSSHEAKSTVQAMFALSVRFEECQMLLGRPVDKQISSPADSSKFEKPHPQD